MIVTINGLINKIPIIKKIYSKILSFILSSKDEFKINFKNIRLYINIKDPIDKKIFLTNKYEEKQTNFLHKWVQVDKPNIFIDIGANSGIYSLRIAKLFKKLKIIAFEPVLTTFNKLETNIKINFLKKKIKTYNMGLSNTSGLKKMIALKRKNYIQSGGFSFYIPKKKFTDEDVIEYHKSVIGDEVLKFKKKKLQLK